MWLVCTGYDENLQARVREAVAKYGVEHVSRVFRVAREDIRAWLEDNPIFDPSLKQRRMSSRLDKLEMKAGSPLPASQPVHKKNKDTKSKPLPIVKGGMITRLRLLIRRGFLSEHLLAQAINLPLDVVSSCIKKVRSQPGHVAASMKVWLENLLAHFPKLGLNPTGELFPLLN